MRWTREGVHPLLQVRAYIASNDWVTNWEEKTIQLEALRYFIKNATKKWQDVISMHLKELI